MRLFLASNIFMGLLVIACGCGIDTPATSDGEPDATDTADASAGDTDGSDASDMADGGDALDAADAEDDTSADTETEDGRDTDEPPNTAVGTAERPVEAQLPSDYDPAQSYPLVVMLHGYGMSDGSVDAMFDLSERIDERDFILVTPLGLRDSTGQRYWNATDYCCDHYGNEPDDAGYLIGVIDRASQQLAVDPDKVLVVGFSNGGFMAHRMACDYPNQLAGVASLSGSSFDDADDCSATDGGPRVLQIHGTADTVVGYYGTLVYPGARTVVERWAERNQCNADATDIGNADFDLNVFGDETWQREWEGCRGHSRVGLWSIQGGLHFPTLRDEFAPAMLDFLLQ